MLTLLRHNYWSIVFILKKSYPMHAMVRPCTFFYRYRSRCGDGVSTTHYSSVISQIFKPHNEVPLLNIDRNFTSRFIKRSVSEDTVPKFTRDIHRGEPI